MTKAQFNIIISGTNVLFSLKNEKSDLLNNVLTISVKVSAFLVYFS